ncbi:MAG: hypothetical protein SXV54_21075 [Chloroflexota bacterium]|nr:hypothetical protein [Chloroflexota bacterium]
MRWKNFTVDDLQKGLVDKLTLEPVKKRRRAPHPVFWYVLDGKKEIKVTLPNVHGGSGSISIGFLQQIKRGLRLTNRQFEDLVNCPLTADEFETIIREQKS